VIVVVGGGPGGATTAARLAQHGRKVVVLEKETFPRFHLGESLLPQSMPILAAVGLESELKARFQVKRGARFVDSRTGHPEIVSRYGFAEAFDKSAPSAYQVPRDEFDELLLRNAERLGAEVRERWSVTRILFDGARAVGVEAIAPDGVTHTIDAELVVDATGRDALIAHAQRSSSVLPGLDKTALFSHFTGAWRDEGERDGDIQIVVFDGGWFWFIPFKDGRTSVGAVVSSAWMKDQRARSPGSPGSPAMTTDGMFKAAVAASQVATRFLEGATQQFPGRAAADFSFRVKDVAGPGWLIVGDAGGFIDPLFSTGAHLAMHGGFEAADVIHAGLADGDLSPQRFAAWTERMRRGADLFLGSVQAFYAGTLSDYIFAEKQHPFLRHAITSLLAGDVFGEDARWAKELRTRFPAQS
jgi:flavin-dependent dehydrogenase